MNSKLHKELMADIWSKVSSTRDEGQKEYAQDKENVFANFERIAKLQELKREQVLMTYLLKHIDGIQSYVKGHKDQREDIRGRITDAIVYLTLLWGMIDDKELAFHINNLSPDDKKGVERPFKQEWISEPTLDERIAMAEKERNNGSIKTNGTSQRS